MQYEVAAEVLRLCKTNYVSTCIETSGYAKWENFKQVAQYCNYVFIDLKNINSKKHEKFTGVPNELILENIQKLCEYSKEKYLKVIIRRPIIPGYNDDDETIIQSARFIAGLPVNSEINILPYHNLGELKYGMIGKEYSIKELKMLTNKDHEIIRVRDLSYKYAPNNRISIGGDAIDLTEN